MSTDDHLIRTINVDNFPTKEVYAIFQPTTKYEWMITIFANEEEWKAQIQQLESLVFNKKLYKVGIITPYSVTSTVDVKINLKKG